MMQRRKGSSGEREIAGIIRGLSGWDIQRRVRQHDGDSDLEGIPGFSVEVKRHAKCTRSIIEVWWNQTVSQAKGKIPVLFYRVDRDSWRAVYPLAVHLVSQHEDMWTDYLWTIETSAEGFVSVAREIAFQRER
jgi:hypothetical protein